MQRTAAGLAQPAQLPVYVMHTPSLPERGQAMQAQLEAAQAVDVTWMLCANSGDVASLGEHAVNLRTTR